MVGVPLSCCHLTKMKSKLFCKMSSRFTFTHTKKDLFSSSQSLTMESIPLKSTTAGYLTLTLLQDCEFHVEVMCAFVNWVTMLYAREACKICL